MHLAPSNPMRSLTPLSHYETSVLNSSSSSRNSSSGRVGPEVHFFIPFLLLRPPFGSSPRPHGRSDGPRTLNGKLTHMLSYSAPGVAPSSAKKPHVHAHLFMRDASPWGARGSVNERRHRPKHSRHYRATHRVIRSSRNTVACFLTIFLRSG